LTNLSMRRACGINSRVIRGSTLHDGLFQSMR
jgi:hypothetical protein